MPASFTATNHNIRPCDHTSASNDVSSNIADDIVISGFSGRLPESSNIEEFKQKLFDGVDLVSDDERRWPRNLYGLPARTGKIKDLTSFDATFFKVHPKQANVMDPRIRMLLELTHESIIDAGVNPTDLRGSKTGVFVALSDNESEEYWLADPERTEKGYGKTGCARVMFANRISYIFDFIGPSFTLDTGCSSSLYAMHQGITAMRTGQCDSAIVAGANLHLKPGIAVQLHRLGVLSPDGSCKSFDSSGNGYVRSDAVVVMYLQKLKDAKRVYATIVNSKVGNDGHKSQGIAFPSGHMMIKLMRELYAEAEIDPMKVNYVEAHGTGTKVGDPQELNSLTDFYRVKDRKTPLLIGSVKSNMGHSEAASGLCAVAKVLIAMETGFIPPNLHFKSPNKDIPALWDGSIKVVTEPTPWNGGLVGITNFGVGGTNAHIVLKSNPKPKISSFKCNVPKLVAVSGRTKEAVNFLLDKISNHKDDDGFFGVIHSIHSKNIPGHLYRGYHIYNDNNDREVSEVCGNAERRPVWYVFTGMGSQWPGMSKELMCIPTFENSLRRCAETLKSLGIDLMNLIMNGTKENIFGDVLNSYVSIVSIQVALVDLLTLLDIKPDGIVGHSIGELGCAYADGCFTLQQTVLAAYWRGMSIKKSALAKNMGMAVVGLSWEEAKKRCPPDVFAACHNAVDLVSISGPKDSLNKFMAELKSENIFAKEVESSGVAFHSKYIAEAGPKLRENLEKIIINPKPRTSRWISTSIPESDWNSPLAKWSSPEYHVNNFLAPVLFQEGLAHIPSNSIVIEISPHCLLQAILRRSLPTTVTNIGLLNKGHANNLEFFLTSIGKLYNAGLQPCIAKIYPSVSYPVGRGTPMINSMIKWDHSTKWDVADFSGRSLRYGQSFVEIDLSKDNNAYFVGGRQLFPPMGYLEIVWKALAKLRGEEFIRMPVVFEDVQFHRTTKISKEKTIKFYISILIRTGNFELCEGEFTVVTGKIHVCDKMEKQQLSPSPTVKETKLLDLKTKEIYKELRLRGYEYTGKFKGIISSDNHGTTGKLAWTEDWTSFFETMIQFSTLNYVTRELCVPCKIQKVNIDPIEHKKIVEKFEGKEGVPIYTCSNTGVTKSGGIELKQIKTSPASPSKPVEASVKHEIYSFIPYENSRILHEDVERSKLQAMIVLLQIVQENLTHEKVTAIELPGEKAYETLMAPIVLSVFQNQPMFSVSSYLQGGEKTYWSHILMKLGRAVPDLKLAIISQNGYDDTSLKRRGIGTIFKDAQLEPLGQDIHLILAYNILSSYQNAKLKNITDSLKNGGFLLLEESGSLGTTVIEKAGLIMVSKQIVTGRSYVLLKKMENNPEPVVLKITENDFSWLEDVKAVLKKAESVGKKILFVSQEVNLQGFVGLMNCLRRETGSTNIISYIFIQDRNAPKFSLKEQFYVSQLNKQLSANVLKGNQWGSYRHLNFDNKIDVPTVQVTHAYINTLISTDLSSLKWIKSPLNYYKLDQFPTKELCTVYYATLNLRDVMIVTGKQVPKISSDELTCEDWNLGLEFSGRNSKGYRVMGLVSARALATSVFAEPDFLWEVPEKWTLKEAASVPSVYTTSYYCLCVRGGLKAGESVLIHDGSSDIGLASISVALHMGCEVFTTINSDEKREVLKKIFSQLNDSNILSFHDSSFEEIVLNKFNQRGIDLILNSSSSRDESEVSIKCLASDGRFLKISNPDTFNDDTSLNMSLFTKNQSLHSIFVDALFKPNCLDKKKVAKLVTEGIKTGAVRPLPTIVFHAHQLEQAFRLASTGKYSGKVLLKIREEEPQKQTQPIPKTIASNTRTYMNPDKSYVLVGGLGGFGLELTSWMISRGAKHIVLNSRSGVRTGYQSLCLRRWREHAKVNVVISTDDVTTLVGAENIIKAASSHAPVGGIFNLAAVLKDALIQNLEEKDFRAVALPKIDATKHLDTISRKLCPGLDYFVVFSSISSGRGTIGQSNYGMANSAIERICEERKSFGFPGLAVQWSAVGDVGLFTEKMSNESEFHGTCPQRISSCLSTLDLFLQQEHPVVASMVIADNQKSKVPQDREDLLEVIGKIFGIKDVRTVNANNSLTDLGMDSLMGTEIKQILEKNFGIVLSRAEIPALTFNKIKELAAAGNNKSTDNGLASNSSKTETSTVK